jgi:rhomboid protease GluP
LTRRLPVTFGLIAACVAVYLLVAAADTASGNDFASGLLYQSGDAFSLGALVPGLVALGEVWRLLTSAFLHSGFTHLALNMLSLYFLGSFAEATFGRMRFLALYLLSGISGGLAYLYFSPLDSIAVGASGAIFGLIGGVFGYAIRRGTFSPRDPVIGQLLFLTAINLFIGASIPNVSNTAHLGGLVGGLVFGYLMANTVYARKPLVALRPVLIALGIEAILLIAWFLLV